MSISCHLYDQFEIAIMKHQKVKLSFHANKPDFVGYLKDLQTREGKEFVITESSDEICLDDVTDITVV
ncbi:hypothetical protein [Hydrogenovibrio kuenenii]|uniref:hypothetical protein n=1 Tax=Hydrogenovibrio kuenenii TaxID=63658 RepID=UPI000466727E|nr:hypothetical protein [Hydrogenovibrio kuenenii]